MFRTSLPPQSSSGQSSTAHPPDVTKRVLATSLTTGAFSDVSYSLYSRRTSDGKVGYPRIAYANSSVLQAAGEYFVAREYCTYRSVKFETTYQIYRHTELAGGFDTNRRLERDTNDYTYDDDSDIEDFVDAGNDLAEDNDEVSHNSLNSISFNPSCPQEAGDTTAKDPEREVTQDLETGVTLNVAVPDIAFATYVSTDYSRDALTFRFLSVLYCALIGGFAAYWETEQGVRILNVAIIIITVCIRLPI